MSEEIVVRQMAILAELLVLCFRHQPDRVAHVRQELEQTFREWQSIVQEKEQGR